MNLAKSVTIRQVANKEAKQLGLDKRSIDGSLEGGFTMLPFSSRGYSVRRNEDGTFKTGLDYEKEAPMIAKLESTLGQDLSPSSAFWSKLRIEFSFRGSIIGTWGLVDPIQFLKYRAALANGYLAPSEEDIMNTEKYKEAVFYVYDSKNLLEKKMALTELKDEVSSLIYKYKNDADMLLFIHSALGDKVNMSHSAGALYTMLSEKKDGYVKREQFENLLNILKTPVTELQADYYVDKAIMHQILKLNKDDGFYYFNGEVKLKRSSKETKQFLSLPENEEILFLISQEIKDRFKS